MVVRLSKLLALKVYFDLEQSSEHQLIPSKLYDCVYFGFSSNTLGEGCRSSFEAPVDPYLVLGGFLGDGCIAGEHNVRHAHALLLSFIVVNHYNNSEALEKAKAWEKR